MQFEMTKRGLLLDDKGGLCEAGYSKTLLKEYDRSMIKAPALRIKEWDYYFISNGSFGLALTIADNSYMALAGVSFLDFAKPRQRTLNRMKAMTLGKTGLPPTSEKGDVFIDAGGSTLFFGNDGETRELRCRVCGFEKNRELSADIVLTDAPEESMVIATPFAGAPKAFYYNQKINCLRASGMVRIGDDVYRFDREDSFAVLDWGRGVWPYDNKWYWASASGAIGGRTFGFNLGCGFGDTSAATENMVFCGGRANKLERIDVVLPDDLMKKWSFGSSDGRFEAEFVPLIDRACLANAGVVRSDQHQVFGKFTGKTLLDSGETLEFRDFFGFAEKVSNKW